MEKERLLLLWGEEKFKKSPLILQQLGKFIHITLVDSAMPKDWSGSQVAMSLAMAGKWIDPFGAVHVALDPLCNTLVAVGPFDQQPLPLEQAFVIGDQFRQPLKRCRGFQDQSFHESGLPEVETAEVNL